MKNLQQLLMIALMTGMVAMNAEAKRSAPKDVAPITKDGIVYAAPRDHMGCVQAKNEKTGQSVWLRQVYVVKYDVQMETDVQDCFITSLRIDGDKLLVTNEDGGQFQVDLGTLAVKTLSGREVIDRTAKKNAVPKP
jgi:hypothetical protein